MLVRSVCVLLIMVMSCKTLPILVKSHVVFYWSPEPYVKERLKLTGIDGNKSEMSNPGGSPKKIQKITLQTFTKSITENLQSAKLLEGRFPLLVKSNTVQITPYRIGNKRDGRGSQEIFQNPYEITSAFTKRKLFAAPSPGMEKAAKDTAGESEKSSEHLKQAISVTAKKKGGPQEYIATWRRLRQQILTLKKKVSSSRQQLDAPGNLILERIEEGDELKRRASTVSNLQRLNHLGKKPDIKLVTALKTTYKDLNDGISGIRQRVKKIQNSLPVATVDAEVQNLDKELRKQMQFVVPGVDAAINTAWSAMTDSLADTTNFQYSELRDMPPSPVISIYRYGDSPWEKTTLKDDLKNMQTSINSLSRQSIEPKDPDLQRVDKVLKDLLTRTYLSKAFSTADSVIRSNIKENLKSSFNPNDIYFGVDHHQDADVDEETSTVKDGVFYLFDSRDRPLVPKVQEGIDKNFDAGAVTDKTVGGGFHEFGGQPPLEITELRDKRNAQRRKTYEKRKKSMIRQGINIFSNKGRLILGKHNAERHLYRKARAADQPQHAGSRKKAVSKGSVVYDDEKEGIRLDIHSIKKKLDMSGDKPPKHTKIKSKEDTESFNMIDMGALDNKKISWRKKLPPYNEEEEVDETGELGLDIPFSRKNQLFEHIDRVPAKLSEAESIEMDSDSESDDESMELGTLINSDDKLDELSFKRDKNRLNAYKKTAGLRLFPTEPWRNINPKYNRIYAGLSGDIRLGPGEEVDDTDNPIYGLDRNYPATGPNAGSEVGSLSYWTKEIRKLDDSDRKNTILAGELNKDFFGDENPRTSLRNGDLLFLDAGEEVRRQSSPRVSDLFAEQVKNIIQDTKEGQDHIVKSGRKHLPSWRHDLDFDVVTSEENEHVRRKEDELVNLINPGLDVMIRRMEKSEADNRPGPNELAKVDKIVLGLLDDAPVNPEEFDYLKQLADVSVFTKPIKSNPTNVDDALPPDKITKSGLDSLDRAAKTLTLIDQDMKYRHEKNLKDELADVEKLRRQVKFDKENAKMEKMYADIKAIPKLEAMNNDLRKKRKKQYEHIKNTLEKAYGKRLSKQKETYNKFMKLAREIKKNKKELDRMAGYL